MMVGILVRYYYHHLFLRTLENKYPELYLSLGEPKMFTRYPISTKFILRDNSSGETFTKYAKFMTGKQWKELNDYDLEKYASYRSYSNYLLFMLFLFVLFSNHLAGP